MNNRRINGLLIKVSEGDNDAFARLYDEARGGVYSFAYTYLHDSHDAEDVMQTVFLKVKCGIHTYRHNTNAIAWLLEITKHTALDMIRQKGRHTDIEQTEMPSSDFSYTTITDLVERVLSEEDARIVVLHVLWGYRHREIGELLSMPTGTVTSRYKRAIDKLKTKLKEVDG